MKNNLVIRACALLLIVLGGILIAMTPDAKTVTVQADRSTHSWYIMPQGEGKQPIAADDAPFKDQYQIIYLGDPAERKIWLTFDLGYENGNTEKILDVLKEHQIQAAFFVCGNVLNRNPELIQRMANEGHVVCNHTENHIDLSNQTKEVIQKELQTLEEKYQQLTGKSMSRLMRPPEGKYSENSLAILNELGYTPVFWSFAYKDWLENDQPSAEKAMQTITSRAHPGMVMLLHSTSSTNAEIMDHMIRTLQEKGYAFGNACELERMVKG